MEPDKKTRGRDEKREQLRYAKTLSDILHLHRWMGGEQVGLATIFGLANGVESVIKESLPHGISDKTQEKIEDVLQDVLNGTQSPDSLAIKDRLRRDGIDDGDAITIMQLCVLQSRFTPEIKRIAESGSAFSSVFGDRTKTADWDGAKIYMELVVDLDLGEQKSKMISTFAPCLPRIGETIDLSDLFGKKAGSMWMEVVGIEYSAHRMDDPLDKQPMTKLIPYVILESCKSETK